MHWNVRELRTKRAERDREREGDGDSEWGEMGREKKEYRKGERPKVDVGRERWRKKKRHN